MRRNALKSTLVVSATFLALLAFSGCDGGESSSQVVIVTNKAAPEVKPQPTVPDTIAPEPTPVQPRATQITSALGSTPPEPPVLVR